MSEDHDIMGAGWGFPIDVNGRGGIQLVASIRDATSEIVKAGGRGRGSVPERQRHAGRNGKGVQV